MINFEKVSVNDADVIKELSDLATEIVKEHFDPIIGAAQNDYMINMFQSVPAITEQLKNGYQYFFVSNVSGKKIGFLAFYPREKDIYLSKMYLHKDQRGKGIAKEMFQFVIEQIQGYGFSSIVLNVNKNNIIAITAYEKMGFRKIRAEKNYIGNGFYMDDWVYEYIIDKDK